MIEHAYRSERRQLVRVCVYMHVCDARACLSLSLSLSLSPCVCVRVCVCACVCVCVCACVYTCVCASVGWRDVRTANTKV